MNTFAPFFIVSAALSGDTEHEAQARTFTLATQLRALGFAVDNVRGCYKGATEPALIAIPFERVEFVDAERAVRRLARVYGQETILAVDANRRATLVYTVDYFIEPLGAFRNVPEHEARKRDAWTERCGQYYITERRAA